MSEVTRLLRQSGLSELACQFAKFIERLDNTDNPVVALSAGLLSEVVLEGHVCLNLNSLSAATLPIVAYFPDNIESFRQLLLESNVVGEPGDFAPMVITEQGQLYLYRFWQDEVDVARLIKERSQMPVDYDASQIIEQFSQWTTELIGTDWQRVAVLSAQTQRLTIISGGPGTGKTTIVKRIIAMLTQQSSELRIALAAPTGKAAARLQQAVESHEGEIQAKTLHRLLGLTPTNEHGRYSVENPLPVDVLIVDEASMIDVSLMAKLLKALSKKARLILLGDSQQLASVESGAVLSNLCEQGASFSHEFRALAEKCGITELSPESGASLLTNQLIQLQHSYRFDAGSVIGQLAEKVNAGDANSVIHIIEQQHPAICFPPSDKQLLTELKQGYQAFIDSVNQHGQPEQTLAAFESFRVLAALKQGPQSVESVNRLMRQYLSQIGWSSQQDFYHGRPIMVTRNDERQRLYNGDVGVILEDDTGQLKACFCFDSTPRWVAINRLPAHETAFAMTIHKSQGSEFDRVCIVLPELVSPILTRELLYTAITRARDTLSILASPAIVKETVNTQHQRETGLKTQLMQTS